MANIKVESDKMKTTSGEMKKTSSELFSVAEKVWGVSSGLRFETVTREAISSRLRDCAQNTQNLRNHTDEAARTLHAIAEMYENTERKNIGTAQGAGTSGSSDGSSGSSSVTREDDLADAKGQNSDGRAYDGDPVNMATGNFTWKREYLRMRGRFPLIFSLFYNSMERRPGPAGSGWTHNYDIRLVQTGQRIRVCLEDGQEESFDVREDGTIENAFSRSNTLTLLPEEGYLYETKAGRRYRFTTEGLLTEIRNRSGQGVVLSYNSKGQPEKVEASGGRFFSFSYNAMDLLAEVRDSAGRSISLFYTQEGLLKEVRNEAGGSFRFAYDEAGILAAITNPRNTVSLANTFDPAGRILLQELPGGAKYVYSYDDQAQSVTMTEPSGNRVVYRHDDHFRTTEVVWEDGTAVSQYNARNQRTLKIDKMGNRTSYDYDAAGNMIFSMNALGEVMTAEYNSLHLPVRLKVCDELFQENDYDDRGNLTRRADALGRAVTMEYDEHGFPAVMVQPDGTRILLSFDEAGNIVKVTGPDGSVTGYTYDAAGNVTASVDPNGNRTCFGYDARGNIVCVENAMGLKRTYEYNESDLVTRIVDFDGSQVSYAYNECNKLSQMTDPEGGTIRYEYDAMQHITCITDQNGEKTRLSYDSLGRLIQAELANGSVFAYTYDANNNRTGIKGPDGGEARISYDGLNRPVQLVAADGAGAELSYDHFGRVTCITDTAGNMERVEYNAAGQRTARIDVFGNRTEYRYDEAGRLSSVAGINGRTTTYTYDEAGRLQRAVYPDGLGECFTYDRNGNLTDRVFDDGRELHLTYDCLDRVIEKRGRDGALLCAYAYDPAGNLTSLRDAWGNVTEFRHSPCGRLIKTLDPEGGCAEFTYDAAGRLVEVVRSEVQKAEGLAVPEEDPAAASGEEAYEEALGLNRLHGMRRQQYLRGAGGQVTESVDPLGRVTSFVYDALGRVSRRTDGDGLVTLYSYNAGGKLSEVTYGALPQDAHAGEAGPDVDPEALPESRTVKYGYNALRQLTEIHDWLGITEIQRNQRGQVTRVTDPEGRTAEYTYGTYGERRTLTCPDGRTWQYTYNEALRLTGITDGEDMVRYAYDQTGRLAEKQLGDRLSMHYEYLPEGLLSRLTVKDGEGILDDYQFSYDQGGRRAGAEILRRDLPEASGTYEYEYDRLSRLTGVRKDNAPVEQYRYDGFGNRTASILGGEQTEYIYNEADELIRMRSAEESAEYTYSGAGRLLSEYRGGQLFTERTYDPTGRTAAVTGRDGQSLRMIYNGLGMLMGEQQLDAAGRVLSETSFFRDLAHGFRNLLSEQNAEGVVDYLRDTGVAAAKKEGGAVCWMVQDALGSTIREISPERTAGYAYDSFGRQSAGNGTPRFGFTGYRSLSSGVFDAEAREYDPRMGRFLQRDKFAADLTHISSLNRYSYCWNQPLQFVDQDGLWPTWNDVGNWFQDRAADIKDFGADLYEDFNNTCEYLENKAVETINSLPTLDQVVDKVNEYIPVESWIEGGFEKAYELWDSLPSGVRDHISDGFDWTLHKIRDITEIDIPFTDTSLSDIFNKLSTSDIGRAVLDRLNFHSDENGIFHTDPKCWQISGGYNTFYDEVFGGFTSMETKQVKFTDANGQEYILWMWKGDYYNLGAGGECGIYRGDGNHYQCATDTGLKMSLVITDDEGNVIVNYTPKDDQWWITGFNPKYQDMEASNLNATAVLDFSANPALWAAFLQAYKDGAYDGRSVCIDEKAKTVRLSW